jgi:uncharacterized protein YifN (PemK superfamily)
MKTRPNLVTVVPLSTTPPNPIAPYHCEIDINVELPDRWSAKRCWVKGDMIYSLGFDRVDLFCLDKTPDGRRIYQTETVSRDTLLTVQRCVMAGLGIRP